MTPNASQDKVCLIGPFPLPYGGVSVHLARLREGLRAHGFSVSSLGTGRAAPPPDIDSWLGNSLIRHLLRPGRQCRGIAHLHNSVSVLSALATLSLRLAGRPVVITLHGVPKNKLTQGRGYDPFLRFALRLCDQLVVVNESIKRSASRFVPEDRIHVIPAFIPPGVEERGVFSDAVGDWMKKSGDGPLLSFGVFRILTDEPVAGNEHDVYGIRVIADLIERIATDWPGLRCAGFFSTEPRNEEENAYLDEHCGRMRARLGDRLGIFFNEYAVPTIGASDVFLRPTFTDGDSVALREAICMGVPTVASDVVKRPESVRLFKTGDPASLAEAVRDLLDREPGSAGAPSAHEDREGIASLLEVYRRASQRART